MRVTEKKIPAKKTKIEKPVNSVNKEINKMFLIYIRLVCKLRDIFNSNKIKLNYSLWHKRVSFSYQLNLNIWRINSERIARTTRLVNFFFPNKN